MAIMLTRDSVKYVCRLILSYYPEIIQKNIYFLQQYFNVLSNNLSPNQNKKTTNITSNLF